MPGRVDGVGVMPGRAVGTEHAPLILMLRISVADVLLPTLTTGERPVRMSRIQLQRELFIPRVLSLVMSFEGSMVLNAKL